MSIGAKHLESPAGKIAGIVGLKSIGAVIGKLSAIGMEIRYTKTTPLSSKEEAELGYEARYYPAFNVIIKHAGLLLLVDSETTNTKHVQSKLIEPSVSLVKVGRGFANDEEVLFECFNNGIMTSIGLDVFEGEPMIDERLQNRWNVTITPHIGNLTTGQ